MAAAAVISIRLRLMLVQTSERRMGLPLLPRIRERHGCTVSCSTWSLLLPLRWFAIACNLHYNVYVDSHFLLPRSHPQTATCTLSVTRNINLHTHTLYFKTCTLPHAHTLNFNLHTLAGGHASFTEASYRHNRVAATDVSVPWCFHETETTGGTHGEVRRRRCNMYL